VRVTTEVVIRRAVDLPAAHDLLVRLAAQIVAPASATPNGYRLLARHPDGAVFEYVSRQREPR
jgi:hypothetical protein